MNCSANTIVIDFPRRGAEMPERTIQGQRIRLLRITLGMQQKELAQKAGISQSLLSDIETGKRLGTGAGVLNSIAAALGVPITELLPDSVPTEPPAVRAIPVDMVYVPVVGTAPGGPPLLVEATTGEQIVVPAEVLAGVRRPRAVLVRGSSMEPDIMDGEYVVIDPDALWQVGDAVVALVGNETTVKRIELVGGAPRLVPANHNHGIVDAAGQDVRVQGIIVWIQPTGRRYRRPGPLV